MSMAGGAGALLIGLVSIPALYGGPRPPTAAAPAKPSAPATATVGPAGSLLLPGASATSSRIRGGTQTPVQRRARVSGSLVADDGKPLLSGAVILSLIDSPDAAQVPPSDVTIQPDGTFEFRNVPPGQYEIRARGLTQPKGTALFAKFRVTVDGTDIDQVALTLVPGATVSGAVIVERKQGARPPAFDTLIVRSPMTDGSSFGDAITGHADSSGRFTIRGVMAGSHVVRVEGLRDPWVLKSVVVRGRDVTDIGIDTEPRQRFTNVRVTITDVASEVSGTVRDADGKPAVDAAVLVVPVNPQLRTKSSRRMKIARTDASGVYRVRGLPKGEYRVVATMEFDEDEAFHRDVADKAASTGEALSVKPLGTHALDLRLATIGGAVRAPAESGF